MKPFTSNKNLSVVVMLALTVGSCGAGQDRQETAGSDSSVSSDTELSATAVETVVTDGFESMVTQNSSGSSLALTDEAADKDQSVYNRTCAVDGNNAVITAATTMERSDSKDRTNMTMTRQVAGSSKQTRVWSMTKDGSAVAVACAANGRTAALDWSGDLAGLKLQLDFERSRTHSLSMTNKKKNKTWSHSRSFSAAGSRTVDWGTIDTAATSFLVREKTVTSTVNRKVTAVNKKGETKELEFAVKTADAAPLKVRVERHLTTKALVKKTIKSGTLVATRNTDGRVESTFADVVLSFDGKDCVGDSGTIVSKFFAEGSDVPVKSLKLTIDGGVYTLTDADTGADAGELSDIACDAEDLVD